jgi:putative redox protein
MTRERRADVILEGEDRFVTRTGTGRSLVFGDASEANEYSPVESVLASLAACSAMDVIGIALKKRQNVDRYEIHAVGEQRDEYPQVLTDVTVTHEVWGVDISVEAIGRCIELSATKYCPVNAMVSAGATTVHHRYAIHSRAAAGDVAPLEAEGEVITTGPYRRPDIQGE